MLVDWEAIHRSKLVRKMNAINFDFDHNQHKCVSSFTKPMDYHFLHFVCMPFLLHVCPHWVENLIE